MITKILSAALALMSFNTLAAQTPVTSLHLTGENDANINSLAGQLGENALLVLFGVIVLIGIVWLLYIWNACAGINRNQKTTGVSSLLILFSLAAGMNMFSSSCTVVQQIRTAETQTMQTTENNYCTCHAPLNHRPYNGNAGMYNPYPYNQYPYNTPSIKSGKPFCGQCGKRIYGSK